MAQFCAGYHPDKNRVVTVLELPFLGVENLEQEVAVSSAVYAASSSNRRNGAVECKASNDVTHATI